MQLERETPKKKGKKKWLIVVLTVVAAALDALLGADIAPTVLGEAEEVAADLQAE